jgi:hypothetical protein
MVADPVDQQLLGVIFTYESDIDGGFGCCHSSKQIEAGDCPVNDPDEVDAVRVLATRYAHVLGYREAWRPQP